MKIFQKEIPDEIAEQICKIQKESLFENTSLNSAKSLVRNGVLFFVELDDKKKVVSFCSINPVLNEWEIYDIATIPQCRNCGFAKKMAAEVLDFAKKNGAEKIFLEVRESNEKAINLYSKFGFEKYSTRKNYYADNGETAVCMVKRL
jgi:ribosomal-protein-alanine acetyltransferase